MIKIRNITFRKFRYDRLDRYVDNSRYINTEELYIGSINIIIYFGPLLTKTKLILGITKQR